MKKKRVVKLMLVATVLGALAAGAELSRMLRALIGPPEPFDVSVVESGEDALEITAALANMDLLSTYTDTYHADLAANKQQFNDRALVIARLPAGWQRVGEVRVVEVEAGGKPLEHRLVGHAVEHDGGVCRLHVQVDVPTTGYMKSRFRRPGSRVVLHVQRQVEGTR